MATAKLTWNFDSETQTLTPKSANPEHAPYLDFAFALQRMKDSYTHEECMTIQSLYDGNDNGTITTSLDGLDKALPQFRKYGVAFTNLVFGDLKKAIEKCYLKLPITEVEQSNSINGNVIRSVLEAVRDLIADYDYCPMGDRYNVPVEEFNALFDEGDLNQYEVPQVRQKLAEGGYIAAKGGRTSIPCRDEKGKVIRVVSFYADKLGLPSEDPKAEESK